MGDVGEEFRDTTEGGDVKEAGAIIVIVRSSGVMFEAWRIKTWNFLNSYTNRFQQRSNGKMNGCLTIKHSNRFNRRYNREPSNVKIKQNFNNN